MILVTLGTHPAPMDRLMTALDDLLASGELDEEIIVTAAAYGKRPVHATALGIQPYATLLEMADSASAIVTHGGPASVALALSAGHPPVVVPRMASLGEHVDDHQVRFAIWFAQERDIEVVLTMDGLGPAIARVQARRDATAAGASVPTQAIDRLRPILTRLR